MAQPVLVFKGPAIARYGFGDPHPFGFDRHDVFHEELAALHLGERVRFGATRDATVDELLLFHSADYIDLVSRKSAEGRGFLDHGDTPAIPGIFNAAASVVGTTLAAVDAVMENRAERAFSPIAGLHHAGRGHAAGFCVFNDCGVAAKYLRAKLGLERIAYVDIDAHPGDGMYYGFEADPYLVFADIHEDGRYLYPGTGAASETGKGPALGAKLNIPLAPGAGDEEFDGAWERVVAFLERSEPEFILLQCGADSLAGDPITHLEFTEDAHAKAAASLCDIADRYAAGRIVATGGGGYNRRNLSRAWTRVVQAFAESN